MHGEFAFCVAQALRERGIPFVFASGYGRKGLPKAFERIPMCEKPLEYELLAAALSEPRDTLEDVYEPFLLQQGFLGRTPRGRIATRKAYAHLGRPAPVRPEEAEQGELFDIEG